ncbi:MAG: hypothetical protein ACYCU6_09320, partial [Acidimicrobiales bacterium]
MLSNSSELVPPCASDAVSLARKRAEKTIGRAQGNLEGTTSCADGRGVRNVNVTVTVLAGPDRRR